MKYAAADDIPEDTDTPAEAPGDTSEDTPAENPADTRYPNSSKPRIQLTTQPAQPAATAQVVQEYDHPSPLSFHQSFPRSTSSLGTNLDSIT